MRAELPSARFAGLLTGFFLVCAYLALRLPHLRDLPVFCDEATYLRWSQLILQDPGQYLFTSMADAKLPLHYWLLALSRPLSTDPVMAGRLLSVFLGALTIVALLALCRELESILPLRRSFGPIAAMLMITCPLVAMYQRMALAEPVLLLEAVVLTWLSVRLARRIAESASRRTLLIEGAWLGGMWAATLLTKQDFSYALWILPPLALSVTLKRKTWRKQAGEFFRAYGLASAIGMACFVPVLFTTSRQSLLTLLFYKPVFTRNAMDLSRWTIFWQNVAYLISPRAEHHFQWWPHDPQAPLESGSLYLYLTPPVLLLAIVGVVLLVRRRQWRLVLLFGGLCGALLLMLLAGANVLYSRYTMLGALPLLLFAAWAASEMVERVNARGQVTGKVLGALMLAMIIAWPGWMTIRGAGDYRSPVLTREDREQFIESYTAGYGVQQAVGWLDQQAAGRPITIVTRTGMGLPNEFTWLSLEGHGDVQLLCDDRNPPLQQGGGEGGTVLVGTEQWIGEHRKSVRIPSGRPVYFMDFVELDGSGGHGKFLSAVKNVGPSAQLVRLFANPPVTSGEPAGYAIAIYELFP